VIALVGGTAVAATTNVTPVAEWCHITHFYYFRCGQIKPKMKMVAYCWHISMFSVEFSEAGKRDKRHTEHSDNKPGRRLSGKQACVLLTADERTTGMYCCSSLNDQLCLLFLLSFYLN